MSAHARRKKEDIDLKRQDDYHDFDDTEYTFEDAYLKEPAQRPEVRGSPDTPEEGGTTTKGENVLTRRGVHAKDTRLGTGNYKVGTQGATMGGEFAEEGLDDETENLGEEIERDDE